MDNVRLEVASRIAAGMAASQFWDENVRRADEVPTSKYTAAFIQAALFIADALIAEEARTRKVNPPNCAHIRYRCAVEGKFCLDCGQKITFL